MKTIGYLDYTKELNQLGKLDDRSKPSLFIWYVKGEKAYHILDPAAQRAKVARSVVFDEGRSWDWSKPGLGGSGSAAGEFIVEYWWPRGARRA